MPPAEDDAEVVGVPGEEHLPGRDVSFGAPRGGVLLLAAYVHVTHRAHITVAHIAMSHC